MLPGTPRKRLVVYVYVLIALTLFLLPLLFHELE